ncbi:hypothetical protein SS50377_20612 [Spironucleus salmonicida]|uniref:Uncharacterized protein n=1 Tax=Spironucleus salmonicida TaxID=348837 RepID=A0A9P8LZI5_9EUKA|nr:hypothetical protein SS50377_20612 [Spironucleus salmonicida]
MNIKLINEIQKQLNGYYRASGFVNCQNEQLSQYKKLLYILQKQYNNIRQILINSTVKSLKLEGKKLSFKQRIELEMSHKMLEFCAKLQDQNLEELEQLKKEMGAIYVQEVM